MEIYGKNLRIQSEYKIFSPNTRKYGPEKTPYLDTLNAVDTEMQYSDAIAYSGGKEGIKTLTPSP